MENQNIELKVLISENNKITVYVDRAGETETYAYYIYKDGQLYEKIPYSPSFIYNYWVMEPGEYFIKVFAKDEEGNKISATTENIDFKGFDQSLLSNNQKEKKIGVKESVCTIIGEIWNNKNRMVRISRYDYALSNKDSYLGKLWGIINPLIQICTFWFVFGMGIRNNQPVGEHAFLPWMLCGLMPWFFFNYGITQGASSIYSKSTTVLKLKYPMSTIPVGAILVGFYNHLVVLLMLAVILMINGYYPNVYWLNLIYYLVYELVFLSAFAMVTSVLTMIARDFQKLLLSVIRLWFYMTPILWSMENLPLWIQRILELNPALYIVTGFRDSLIYSNMFFVRMDSLLFFWILNLVLIVIGCSLQMKFRNKFIDML